ALTAAFKHRDAKKVYWALVARRPKPPSGRIDQALAKRGGPGGEKVVGADEGKPAVTLYRTVERAGGESVGGRISWLALSPLTGRTHQVRAHCALHGVPILGDGKYGGKQAFPEGTGIAKGLHLHARAIELPHPEGGVLRAQAPLPPHMVESFAALGFDPEREGGD
ncbi:MAG: RluA family pseudouridine synthase, partial [Proteobacteria bacterium]|nr:RluA family pseudouridine synthase [Pseudomonadota bacterium]